MKKLALVLVFALALTLSASGEERYDGTVYEAYRPIFNEAYLADWELVSYIEPAGLMLSAAKENAEITATVQESAAAPTNYLTSHVAGVTRYGKDIQGGSVIPLVLGGYEQAARVSYSYRSQRDSGEGDIYNVEMVAAKLKTGYVLTLSLVSWGGGAQADTFLAEFVYGFRLESVKISTTYYALLTHCERQDGAIRLTMDYCDVEYEPSLGVTYAINNDETAFTYTVRDDAWVWLPETEGALYSLKRVGADDIEISIAIESFYNTNEVYPLYQVLFDENGDVIRLQHYNAL